VCGKGEDETAALAEVRAGTEAAAQYADGNIVRYRQAQTRAAAAQTGSEEGVENPRQDRRRHADAVIVKTHFDLAVAAGAGTDAQVALVAAGKGVEHGVLDQVADDLAQGAWIAVAVQAARHFNGDVPRQVFEGWPEGGDDIVHQGAQVELAALLGGLIDGDLLETADQIGPHARRSG